MKRNHEKGGFDGDASVFVKSSMRCTSDCGLAATFDLTVETLFATNHVGTNTPAFEDAVIRVFE
jgi:hypothetical protein